MRDAVGYCCVCGEFGCGDCLKEHEGKHYCHRHYQPFAEAEAREKWRTDFKRRAHRQRLVAHLQDGNVFRGYCYHLDLEEPGFRLDLVDGDGELTGEVRPISFSELKALFYVRSFDGKFEKGHESDEWRPEGGEAVVQFRDGETIEGFTLRPYHEGQPRFYVIPGKPNTNDISVLVEASAVEGVYTPQEFKQRQKAALTAYVHEHAHTGFSREELGGDFHFTAHRYHRAIQYYNVALEHAPNEPRLLKKIASAEYNIGVQHIRNHEYSLALRCMETVLRLAPDNGKARQKAQKLRERLHAAKH
ncbi:MAG TPA: hypothetical protein PKI11_05875, partial [Candidatus Hydrogenedentes bacterium]|nr:hypothetical protein [Candidatus Hydrogenedentota bacterium]